MLSIWENRNQAWNFPGWGPRWTWQCLKGIPSKRQWPVPGPLPFKKFLLSPFYTPLAFALFGALAAFQEAWASGTRSLEKGVLHWVTWGWFNISDNELALVFLDFWIKKKLAGFPAWCWGLSENYLQLLAPPGSSRFNSATHWFNRYYEKTLLVPGIYQVLGIQQWMNPRAQHLAKGNLPAIGRGRGGKQKYIVINGLSAVSENSRRSWHMYWD